MVLNFSDYIFESDSSYYKDQLNPSFWENKGDKQNPEWVLDTVVRKKLLKIAEDFIESNHEVLRKKDVLDIQLVGSLTGYNWTEYSDLDLHIIVDFKDMGRDQKMIDYAMYGIKFEWNTKHDIIMRGHDVEIAVQDINTESYMSTVFSIEKNKWVSKPEYKKPEIDTFLIDKKYSEFSYEIEKLENRLVLASSTPANSRALFNRARKLKSKIVQMRKESLAENGEFSVGNLVFKKLRSGGYIAKLVDVMNSSYDKIYTIKN